MSDNEQPTVELVVLGDSDTTVDLIRLGGRMELDQNHGCVLRINGVEMGYVPGPVVFESGNDGIPTVTVTLSPSVMTLRTVAAEKVVR